jgi:hypothetical protein
MERFDIDDDAETVLAHLLKTTTNHQQLETDRYNGDLSAPSPARSLSIPGEQEKRRSFSHSLVRGAVRVIQGMKKDCSKSVPIPDEHACNIEEFLALANNCGQNDSKEPFPAGSRLKQSRSAENLDVERTSGK